MLSAKCYIVNDIIAQEKGQVTNLMVLFPKIDEKSTKENAREILKSYSPMKRRISFGDSMYNLTQAIQYSDMPKSQSNRNGQEHKTAMMFSYVSKEEIGYTKLLGEIDLAISSLPDLYQKILRYSYCEINTYRINEIAARIKGYRVNEHGQYEEFHYSVKTIEKLKSKALIQFAEAYKGGELLAFQK